LPPSGVTGNVIGLPLSHEGDFCHLETPWFHK
jgi:hypothetical protein